MKDKKIAMIEITMITDDDTGIYKIGELDFGVGGWVSELLKGNPEMREKIAKWLEWLGSQCRKSEPPFNEF